MNQQQPGSNIQIKITDEALKGSYSNMMQVSHTREEFVLDFMNVLPPAGIVTARVVTSPGHVKRIIRALSENLKNYEDTHGEVKEATPPGQQFGFNTNK